MSEKFKLGPLFISVLICCLGYAAGVAVMSVDLGGEFMKIAIVKPGVPMEIALNKESSRKTLTMVAFRDGERHFANQAQNTAIKFPKKAFYHLGQIIGRKFEDPQVQTYKEKFPFYNLEKDEDRGTVLFKIDDETLYSPEELMGMILEKAREYAQDFAEQDIKDCVITVPAFYNQAERRAVKTAAEMVGLNVLQLLSDNAAVALHYGVFRRKDFNSTMKYYMFYDMGATSTTATIVGYNVVKTKEGERLESNPQVTIKGVGFDRTLGGLEFTLRLRAHLAKIFNKQKKVQVQESHRSMAKLLKEAERVKKVLSANHDHHAQVEGLFEEKDFKAAVSRAELEEMCSDLYARVTKPVEEALKVSEITLPEISEVILMGGGTRTPKVQELLLKFLGRSELGKSINTDEAAALGAVYQAAYLGKGFKVKKFGIREGNIYPINVEFEKQKEENTDKTKVIKRTLFSRMNPYPQKKVMTFNKHTYDFSFNVLYSSLDFLSEDDKKAFSSPLIARYNLKGVREVLDKNKGSMESKGIKAHFRMDESGLLTLDKVESVFEKNSTSEEEKSTWSKIGSAIGGLFSSDSSDDDNRVEISPEKIKYETEDLSADEHNEETIAKMEKEAEEKKKKEEEEKKEKAKEDKKSKDENSDKKDDKEKKETETEKESKKSNASEKAEKKAEPKLLNIKEIIKTESEILDLTDLTQEQLKAAKKRLTALREADKAKVELEKAKNELESYCFDMSDKLNLGSGPVHDCSTPLERETLSKQLAEASDWLYEQPDDTKIYEFKQKLKELQVALDPLTRRVYELSERPRALAALRSTVNQSEHFYKWIANMSDTEDPIYTAVEIQTIGKVLNETSKWEAEKLKAQEALPLYESPAMTAEEIFQKVRDLDREMRYLVNKAKNWKPKPKPKEEKKDVNGTKAEEKVENPEDKKSDGEKEAKGSDTVGDAKDEDKSEPKSSEQPKEDTSDAETKPEADTKAEKTEL